LETVLVSNLVDDGISADESNSGAVSGQSQAGVDVQVGVSTARRELGLAIGDAVGDEVILGKRTDKGGGSGPLGRLTGEEVDGFLNGSDTGIEGSVSTVIGLVDGVRPSLGKFCKLDKKNFGWKIQTCGTFSLILMVQALYWSRVGAPPPMAATKLSKRRVIVWRVGSRASETDPAGHPVPACIR
jgi:hypothetical protein